MAIIRGNLEFMSPEEGDADNARQNKITFMGFKAGDADFNDVTSGIGPTTHLQASDDGAGTGLNDVTIGGVYTETASAVYRVKIITAAVPDTFQYSDDDGSTWSASGECNNSGGPQVLSLGVNVFFEATTGHKVGDYWKSSVAEVGDTLTTPLKMAEIEVNHEGKTIGTTVVHTTASGSPVVGDITSGGTYTGDSESVTYYLKIGANGTPDTFAWSTVAGSGYGSEIPITGSNVIEKGITAVFAATTGHGVGNIYSITIGADNKARMIIRTNEGGTVGTTVVLVTGGGGVTALVGDITTGGTYTGGPAPVTYYLKIGANGTPDTFAWSTDNVHYGDEINITVSANAIEKGITANFDDTTGYGVGNIYTITVGADTVKFHANSDVQVAGHVVSENGYLLKIFNSDGTTHLNAYS
jgi:hypothetical protein